LDDAELFNSKIRAMNTLSCEVNFANLFLWSRQSKNSFREYRGRLVVRAEEENFTFFPIGDYFPPAELAELGERFYDVPEEYLQKFPETSRFFEVSRDAGESDYIYDLSHLSTLSGNKLRKKRNLIKQLLGTSPEVETRPITPENFGEFERLAGELFSALEPTPTLEKELITWRAVLENLFDPRLELGTLALYVNGKLEGFDIYSPLGRNCADIHFEKCRHTLKGAPQLLVKLLADHLLAQGYKLMNREQDLNLPNLRHAKSSLDPLLLYRRCNLSRRQG